MDSKIAAATDLKYRPVAVIRTEEKPPAVVGLTDISARKYVRKRLGAEYLSFAMPWSLYLEMEANVWGSFLERSPWVGL